jgi:hypothetical protein
LKLPLDNYGDIIKAARRIGLISRSQQLFCHIDRRMDFRKGQVAPGDGGGANRRCPTMTRPVNPFVKLCWSL